jgi:hypothetical protein
VTNEKAHIASTHNPQGNNHPGRRPQETWSAVHARTKNSADTFVHLTTRLRGYIESIERDPMKWPPAVDWVREVIPFMQIARACINEQRDSSSRELRAIELALESVVEDSQVWFELCRIRGGFYELASYRTTLLNELMAANGRFLRATECSFRVRPRKDGVQ